MPVQYQPYKSMFVSQHSPEIAEILKERYTRNFAMQDEVAQHLAQLQTAPFEGDKAEAANLQKDIYGQIEQFSRRGDYENLTMDVSKLASNYQSRATPLMQNQKLYEADREAKQKEVAAGRITQGDYEGWEALSRLQYDPTVGDYVDYTGVKFDENNRPVAGSYYTPKSLAQYVDVQGEILNQLNSLKEVKEGGYTIQGYQTIDGIQYAMTKEGQTREYVPQDLVRQVTENVLRRPDVQSYMEQQSKFATIKADEPTLNAQLTNYARTLRNSESNEDKIRAAEIENLVSTGNTGAKRKALERAMYSSDYNRYFNMGMNARRPSAYGGGEAMEYSQAYLAGIKAGGGQIASDDIILTQGQTQQILSPLASSPTAGVTEESLKAKTNAASANMNLAAENLIKSSKTLQDMGMDPENMATVLINLDESEAQKFAVQYGLNPQMLETARRAAHSQQNILNTARELQRVTENESKARPDQIVNSAIEMGGLRASELSRNLSSYEDRMSFARDLARELDTKLGVVQMTNVINPDVSNLSIAQQRQNAMAGAGSMGMVMNSATGTRTNVVSSANKLQLLETTLQRVFGVSQSEAEKMAVEAVAQQGSASSFLSRTFGAASSYQDDIDALVSEAENAKKRYDTNLSEFTRGAIRLPELYATEGEAKKVQEQLNGIFKGKQGTEFSARATNTGQSVQSILGGPEQAGAYSVSDVSLIKSMRTDGGIEYMYGVQFSPEKDSGAEPVPRVIIPMDQMVAYLPPQAAQTLTQITNTPADFILDQALAQVVYAPGMVQKTGAKVQHKGPGYNLEFIFTPIIGEGGNHQGFQTIQMVGTTPKGAVNHTFASEQDFYTNYNDFQLKMGSR